MSVSRPALVNANRIFPDTVYLLCTRLMQLEAFIVLDMHNIQDEVSDKVNTMVKGNVLADVVEATNFGWVIIEFIKNELELLLIRNGLDSSTTALKVELLLSTLDGRCTGI